jgi:hypothetical protein
MKYATRALLDKAVRKFVEVTVPVWIGDNGSAPVEEELTFRLRELSGTDRDRFEIAAFKEEDGKRTVDPLYLRARLVAICAVDPESGKRVYSDEEIVILSDGMPASSLSKLFEAAQKLNGLDAVAVETAAKNSVSAPPGASISA